MDASANSIRDEALRRIGRNVMLFQELENILKFLAFAQLPSMPVSKVKATLAGRAESICRKTLGQVASQVVEALYAGSQAETSTPAAITEPWLTFSFQIECDITNLEDNSRTLKALVDERNDLVHHSLSRWDLHDAGNCSRLSAELNEQRCRIIAEIEKYRAFADVAMDACREHQAFFDSEAGKRDLDLFFLQSSRLTMLLAQIATTHARVDGWTPLSVAGSHLSRLIPEQFARLKREHGEGSLHKLVAAIDLFDVQSEGTPNGGTRAIYRARPKMTGHPKL